ncbi:MAG TPA: hypothetical protein VJ783_12705 [Pirellulales bacterium]|nr:hypothetical protein [Pirellulales bacterium]
MSSTDPKPLPSLGFLTVVQYEQHGFLGGYLVLNTSGRPLEFHCTAPVKPNRAQEILYGPTLEPYLYGEQIGQALIAKSQLEPLVICTDLAPVLAVREYVSMPVTLVVQAEATPAGASEASRVYRVDAAAERLKGPIFSLGQNRLAIAPAHAADRERVTAALTPLSEHFDLSEPFERIRGAIDEAQRSGR